MRLPEQLWVKEEERRLVCDLVEMMANEPIILTDKLANTLWFSTAAEEIFQERAEALVNRLCFSLLGFGETGNLPPGMQDAALGKAGRWRGVVVPQGGDQRRFLEISSISSPRGLVSGVFRFSMQEGEQ